MANDKELFQAKYAYKTLCDTLDSMEWKYERDDDNLQINCGATGDDRPIDIRMTVDPEKQLCTLLSQLPFKVAEEDRVLGAVAVCAANYNMVDGSFDYNISNGAIIFRLTTSIRESLIGQEVFRYMILVSCGTVDNYNDKFLMLFKKAMSLDDFIKYVKE